jgi:two-component system, NtrC family, response regulator AtoC
VARILIIDDEPRIRRVLAMLLDDQGHTTVEAPSGQEAIDLVSKTPFDLALVDFSLPGMDGLATFKVLREHDPKLSAIFMTAYGSIRSAVDAMRAGAFDYLTKPFDNDEMLIAVKRALEVRFLSEEVESLRAELARTYGFDDIVGISRPMREIFRVMSKCAGSDATVLILGESGTGKELVARGIHRRSARGGGPFVAVNCSAIPASLVEAEFFGHERGAFTDAKDTRPGKFEQAHGGTLFLDEVGDLPTDAQAKLLRVIEDHEVTRVGGRRPIRVDVRVIAATNKDLEGAASRGQFRQDLFWRLNVLSMRLPPLRERGEDLPLLVDFLFERLNRELGLHISSIAPEARRLLLAHEWPGNVRELENTLRRAVILADAETLQVRDLPLRIRGSSAPNGRPSGEAMTLAEAVARATERVERAVIQATLLEHNGNQSTAADVLGINRRTLYTKMRLYGLTGDEDDEAKS